MKFNAIYNSFSSGEISRYLKGRTDTDEYYKGVDDMTNFIPMKQGGATFRPGTLIDITLPHTHQFGIHAFTPKDGKNYLIKLYPDDGVDQIYIVDATTGIDCTITRSNYIWNSRPDFTNASTAINFLTDASRGEKILRELTFIQQGDVFIIFDGTGSLAPIVGIRTGDTTFTVDSMIQPTLLNANGLTTIDNYSRRQIRVPYKDKNINTNLRLKVSATTGSVTLTAENAVAAPVNYFTGDVVGMLVRITHAATTGVAVITAKASDSSVTALVLTTFGATTASTNFEVSAWNPYDGYPSTGCFHEGRLCTGGSPKYPDTIWCSYLGNIYHFMQTILAQDSATDASGINFFGAATISFPFSFIPASVGANTIKWMFPSDTLLVGTSGIEFSISSGTDTTFSASSIFVKPISSHGSSKVQPVKVGSSILFVSNDGRRLLEIPKRLVEYTSATDISTLSEGIIEKTAELYSPLDGNYLSRKITRLAFQDSESVLWVGARDSDSEKNFMLSLTYDRTAKVLGWAKHLFGATTNAYAEIFSFAVLPNSALNNYSMLYLYSFRANSNYCVEKMWFNPRRSASFALSGDSELQNIYLDASAIYLGVDLTGTLLNINSAQQSILANGDVLSVVAGGQYVGDYAYNSATQQISIPTIASYTAPYIVGFKYNGKIKTMPIEAGAQFGVAQGSTRRPHEMSLFVDRSRGGSYHQANTAKDYPLIKDSLATASALYTGQVRLSLNASYDDHQTVIEQKSPYALTILWLLTKGYTYDA